MSVGSQEASRRFRRELPISEIAAILAEEGIDEASINLFIIELSNTKDLLYTRENVIKSYDKIAKE